MAQELRAQTLQNPFRERKKMASRPAMVMVNVRGKAGEHVHGFCFLNSRAAAFKHFTPFECCSDYWVETKEKSGFAVCVGLNCG